MDGFSVAYCASDLALKYSPDAHAINILPSVCSYRGEVTMIQLKSFIELIETTNQVNSGIQNYYRTIIYLMLCL